MLLLLCYVEVLAYVSAGILIERIEAEGIHAITEARLFERAHAEGLTGFEDTVRYALINNGWLFYGPDDTGEWRDDTRPESLDDIRLTGRLSRGEIGPEPRARKKGGAEDAGDDRGGHWH